MIDTTDFTDVRDTVERLGMFPDLAAIDRRGRHRRWLRTGAATAAPVVAVLAIALVATQLSPPRTSRPAAPSGPPPIAGPLHGPAATVDEPATPLFNAVGDHLRWFYLVKTANGKVALTRTLDGGASWQSTELPAAAQFDPETYILEASGWTITVSGGDEKKNIRAFSADSGQTWRVEPQTRVSTTDQYPTDDKIIFESTIPSLPPFWTLDQTGGKLTGIDPETGLEHPLAVQPPQVLKCGQNDQAADGSLWAICRSKTDQRLLSVSHDRGLTWRTTPAGTTATSSKVGYGWISSADGRTGFAAGPSGSVNMTRDGGATWTQSAPPLPADITAMEPSALPDGVLVSVRGLPNNGRTVVSHDGGRTFAELPNGMSAYSITTAPNGDILARDVGKDYKNSTYKVSTDNGKTWTDVGLPPNLTAPK